MKCPHCLVEFHAERTITPIAYGEDGAWFIESILCPNPECNKFILSLLDADFYETESGFEIYRSSNGNEAIRQRYLIRPKGINRASVPKEVPESIANDYAEACLVLHDSPKASAALSRRSLQNLLRESAGVRKGNLANEIQEVLDSGKLPSHIADSIDAIRNIGNFSAHPLKSQSTGEIIKVEQGEAEWNLEVLEMLFDFYYVQPEKTRKRREALNSKLGEAGKPKMK